jgi:hypothetical protein
MIRHPEMVRRFEDEQARRAPGDYRANLRLYEELWKHAQRLGALPRADPLEGIETDLRLARMLRVR